MTNFAIDPNTGILDATGVTADQHRVVVTVSQQRGPG